jgi:hypothetical protein
MAGIDGKKFSKITRRYRCDEDVIRQIREFIITTMIPDEDVIINHCIVTVNDLSKRLFARSRQTRYFDVVFYVMYYQIGKSFIGEPVLEITYDAAWELSREDYEDRMTEQTKAHTLLREAKEIINPIYNSTFNE